MLEYWYKEILWFISIAIIVPQVIWYIRSILIWETKPHIYTKLIWFILTGIGFVIQFKWGGGPGTWVLLWTTITQAITLILCFKYGTKDITKLDTVLVILALLCIPLYLWVENKLIALVFIIFIDFLWYIPTWRKTYKDPYTEDLILWWFTNVKYILAVFALTEYNWHTMSYLVFLILANASLMFIIYFRRKSLEKKNG